MKIVIDDRIPYIRGFFEPVAQVVYLPGSAITRSHLTDADCLIVRTRTHCNPDLLADTPVRFIGTATIGYDHIETRWCESKGIVWANAPGCNSGAVAQYIQAALQEISTRKRFQISDKTLGIIGVGHVGSKVEKIARELGMRVLLNDPPRDRKEGGHQFTSLTNLLRNSDLVTIHVPLNGEGDDKTAGMVDRAFLESMQPGAILINSSRGEVIDEEAVIRWMQEQHTMHRLDSEYFPLSLILDVWPHEPLLNRQLLDLTTIATPHIAGYSVEGKYNATRMIVSAVADFFHLNCDALKPLVKNGVPVKPGGTPARYDIMADDRRLRESPESFEQQRNTYPERWEYNYPD